MTGAEIIAKFELYVDDNSTLSTQESLDLLNKIRRQVEDFKPWEWLKKEHSTTVSGTDITYPSDFKYVAANYDEYVGEDVPVVFIGANFEPYKVIPFSQRRNYRDRSGYVYVDARQDKLVLTKAVDGSKAVEFDYVYDPGDITTGTSPVWPERFHDIIVHGMAVEFVSIDNTPKGRTYSEENAAKYNALLEAMSYENSMLYGGSRYGNI